MIATLIGQVSEKFLDSIVIDVQGVGYGVYVTSEDLSLIQLNELTKVYIYEHVREQAHDLFGFLERETQNLFEQLLQVNGVGPKMALNVLSIGSVGAVKQAIASGDTRFIQQANGVGKRVAERLVVDLKDKVGLLSSDASLKDILSASVSLNDDEAVAALIALGYSASDAVNALKDVDSSLTTEERLKEALKGGVK